MILAYKGAQINKKRIEHVVKWLKKKQKQNKKIDYKTAQTIVYHTLGKEYGWTPQQIDSLDPTTIVCLLHLIQEDKEREKIALQNLNRTKRN